MATGRSAAAATLASIADGGCALLPAADWDWVSYMLSQAQRRYTDEGLEGRVNSRHIHSAPPRQGRASVAGEWRDGLVVPRLKTLMAGCGVLAT